ncbi:MAG TPA: Ig-like domain-containing protein, partial [Candidatus Competibacteraceae bacterium]|nr:Ig-like domain-containing protein [Candidatus Competibacteraceae bacterium]
DITDNSATVTYVSKFNFHSDVDTFQYVASDGLADSAPGTVSIQVARNFRPPEALDQVVTTAEDQSILITLAADDPDGVAGVDFNGLDRLSYRIVEPPAHGELTLESADDATAVYRYQPESDYFGADPFTFIANDGRDDSEPATVSLTVTAVDDPPQLTRLTAPPRIGAGFPTLIHGQFRDDGADDHSVTVNWGDGSPVEVEGDFIEDEEKARLEGIKLVKPLAGNGRGRAIGQHIYTRTGDQTVQFCIRDDQSRESCMEQTVSPQRLVNLGLQVAEPDEPVIAAGQPLSVEVRISNLEPKGVAGLIAETVTLRGRVSGAPVTFTGSSSGTCEGNDNGVFTCSFGALGVGEQRSVTLTFATDAQLDAEADAMLTFQARTETPAINKVTETFIMRRISVGANSGKASAQSSAPDRRLFNGADNEEPTAESIHFAAARLLTFPELPETLRVILGESATVIRDAQQSADGQVMVFATEAALLPEDGNGVSDIYRFDIVSHRLQRLSVGQYGQSADAPSHSPRMDGTGQRVVFLSAASNLTSGIPGAAEQLYLYDERRGDLIRLSETAHGHPADAAITYPLIDAAGEQVVYRSAARNLGHGPGLYLHDLLTDQLAPIAFDEWGRLDGAGADVPAADADLSLIAYQRPTADGLGGESTQVYLYDRARQMTERASPSLFAANGLPVSGCCASVSGDGRYLAYREATVAGEPALARPEPHPGARVRSPSGRASAGVPQREPRIVVDRSAARSATRARPASRAESIGDRMR